MTDTHTAGRHTLADVRAAFERLETKDKAAFVLEAAFGTLGEAVETAGRGIAEIVEDLAESFEESFADDEDDDPNEDDE